MFKVCEIMASRGFSTLTLTNMMARGSPTEYQIWCNHLLILIVSQTDTVWIFGFTDQENRFGQSPVKPNYSHFEDVTGTGDGW